MGNHTEYVIDLPDPVYPNKETLSKLVFCPDDRKHTLFRMRLDNDSYGVMHLCSRETLREMRDALNELLGEEQPESDSLPARRSEVRRCVESVILLANHLGVKPNDISAVTGLPPMVVGLALRDKQRPKNPPKGR